MADTKVSALTADASPTGDDLIYTVNDPGGTPASRKVTITNLAASAAFTSAYVPATGGTFSGDLIVTEEASLGNGALTVDDVTGDVEIPAGKLTVSNTPHAEVYLIDSDAAKTWMIRHGSGVLYFDPETAEGEFRIRNLGNSAAFSFTTGDMNLWIGGNLELDNDNGVRIKDSGGTVRKVLNITPGDDMNIGTGADVLRNLYLNGGDNVILRTAGSTPTLTLNRDLSATFAGDIDAGGIIDYTGTMGNSALDPTTDAPADWVEIAIGGTTYYIPAYAAS